MINFLGGFLAYLCQKHGSSERLYSYRSSVFLVPGIEKNAFTIRLQLNGGSCLAPKCFFDREQNS
ncbi:MAG: hypothetical protein ACI965_002519 [Paraglaciecola sp.]|jgi:hypothetical protein